MASLDSYEKLKHLYGIRNRFWARRGGELSPLLRDAHDRALVQNHRALLIALRSVERQIRRGDGLSDTFIASHFYRSFARSLQHLRKTGPFKLRPGQKVAVLIKGEHASLTIRNSDGSLDTNMRQRLLFALERIASSLPEVNPENLRESTPGEWATATLLKMLPLEADPPPEEKEAWDDLLDSPTGQLIGNYIPGFSILLKLYRERSRLKDGDWIAVAGELIGDGARSGAQGMVKFLLSQMRSGAKLAGPLSFLFGISVDRAMSLQKQCDRVDAERRRIEELLPLYRQYHKNS